MSSLSDCGILKFVDNVKINMNRQNRRDNYPPPTATPLPEIKLHPLKYLNNRDKYDLMNAIPNRFKTRGVHLNTN